MHTNQGTKLCPEMTKPSIILKVFNRPDLLEKCLARLFSCHGIEDVNLIVVEQRGNNAVHELIELHREKFVCVIETEPVGESVDAFITNNMMMGYQIAFEYWKSDYVISIEEDVIIASDAIFFVKEMFLRYSRNPRFRGVNLGSQIPLKPGNENKYSLSRFGIHGPAGMITRRTWNRVNQKRVLKNDTVIFDAQLEFILKSGFMIVPHCSRFIDLGTFSERTGSNYFAPENQFSEVVALYFSGLRSSFVGESVECGEFQRSDTLPIWRSDCLLYDPKSNLLFDLKEKLYPLLQTRIGMLYLKFRSGWQ